MKRYERFVVFGALISAVVSLGTFLYFGYLSSFLVPRAGTGDFRLDSPLLPTGWETYSTNVWSVGHPPEYSATVLADGSVYFFPTGADEARTYFSVVPKSGSLSAIKISREAEGYRDPVDVSIVHYPALKYSTSTAHVDYIIDHGDSLYEVSSDVFTDAIISTMFATFQFLQ